MTAFATSVAKRMSRSSELTWIRIKGIISSARKNMPHSRLGRRVLFAIPIGRSSLPTALLDYYCSAALDGDTDGDDACALSRRCKACAGARHRTPAEGDRDSVTYEDTATWRRYCSPMSGPPWTR